MNPIALTAPDGVIYAYACGVCGHVAAVGRIMAIPTPDERVARVLRAAADSEGRATTCCTCRDCGAPLVREDPDENNMVRLRCGFVCAACDDKAEKERMWRRWGWMWSNVAEAIARGITTEAEWLADCKEPDE